MNVALRNYLRLLLRYGGAYVPTRVIVLPYPHLANGLQVNKPWRQQAQVLRTSDTDSKYMNHFPRYALDKQSNFCSYLLHHRYV